MRRRIPITKRNISSQIGPSKPKNPAGFITKEISKPVGTFKKQQTRTIPRGFNPEIYKKLNPDLGSFNTKQLLNHYLTIGYEEGRKWEIEIPNDFDWKEYVGINNLRIIRNEIQAKNHYLRLGFLNNLKYTLKPIEKPLTNIIENNVEISEKIENDLKRLLVEFNVEEIKWKEYIEQHPDLIPKIEVLSKIEEMLGSKINNISSFIFNSTYLKIFEWLLAKSSDTLLIYFHSLDINGEQIFNKIDSKILKIIVHNEEETYLKDDVLLVSKNEVNLINGIIKSNNLKIYIFFYDVKSIANIFEIKTENIKLINLINDIDSFTETKNDEFYSKIDFFMCFEELENVNDSLCSVIKCNLDRESILECLSKKNNKLDTTIISIFYNNSDIITFFEQNLKLIKDCNFILIDNNSSDNTYEKLVDLMNRYENIRVFKNSINGCSSGRNLGLENVYDNTKYVLFLDSDHQIKDISIISKMKNEINENIGYVGYYGGKIDHSELIAGSLLDNRLVFEIKDGDNMYLGCGCSMIDYEIIKKTNLRFDINYDPFSVQDVDFSYQLKKITKLLKMRLANEIEHLKHNTTSKFSSEFKRSLLEKNTKYFKDKYSRKFEEEDKRKRFFIERGINQVHISQSLKHLDRIRDIYGLIRYNSRENNLLVFGLYDINDRRILVNHRGKVYIMWGGTDEELIQNDILFYLKSNENIYHFAISDDLELRLKNRGLKNVERIELDLTNYDVFKPVKELGKKIFIYNGYSKDKKMEERYGKKIYDEVVKKLPEYEYIYSNELGGIANEKMYDIYKQCFIGLRLTSKDGNANMVSEMKAMEIPVIHNQSEYGIKWGSVDEIIRKIKIREPGIENNSFERLNDNPIDMFNITSVDNEMIVEIKKNIETFDNIIQKYKNILFICGDYPGYGGAATNCNNLHDYYKKKGHNTFAFYFNFEKTNIKSESSDIYIGKIDEIRTLRFKPDLIILKSFVNYDLKSLFKCPIFYLIGGIYKNNLDKYYYELGTKEENDIYMNELVIKQIKNSDYSFSNSSHTQEILEKLYELKTYLFYSSFVPFLEKSILIDEKMHDRKYEYGLIVSNFNRKIKNIETSIDFLKDKENVILIGKGSKNFESYGFTCVDLVDANKMEDYYRQIKILVQDSYYESCSNVKIEALYNGCYLKSVIIISSTQYPGYGGAATNAYKLIKYFREKKYRVAGLFFHNNINIDYDPDKIGGIFCYIYDLKMNLNEKQKIYFDINNYLKIQPNLCLAKNIVAPILCKEIFKCFNVYLVSGINQFYEFFKNKTAQDVLSSKENLENIYKNIQEQETLFTTDKIVFNSKLTADIFKKINKNNNNLYKILPTIIDTTINPEFKIKYTEKSNDILICCSNLNRVEKNNKFLIQVLKNKEFDNFKKIIIGENFEDFKCIINSQCKGLISNEATISYMKKSKILLFPSLCDANPNTVREAYFYGCLPLITRNIGNYELFPEYLVCKNFSINEWTSKIKFLLENYILLKSTEIKFNNLNLEKLVNLPFLKD